MRWVAEPLPAELGDLGLLNPLVSAAGRLLVLMGKLRNLVQPPNVPALRASTAEAVQQFDAAACAIAIDRRDDRLRKDRKSVV